MKDQAFAALMAVTRLELEARANHIEAVKTQASHTADLAHQRNRCDEQESYARQHDEDPDESWRTYEKDHRLHNLRHDRFRLEDLESRMAGRDSWVERSAAIEREAAAALTAVRRVVAALYGEGL